MTESISVTLKSASGQALWRSQAVIIGQHISYLPYKGNFNRNQVGNLNPTETSREYTMYHKLAYMICILIWCNYYFFFKYLLLFIPWKMQTLRKICIQPWCSRRQNKRKRKHSMHHCSHLQGFQSIQDRFFYDVRN